MLKRLIIVSLILLLLFLFVAKRGAGASPRHTIVSAVPPEGAVLLLNLPNVYILPDSPFYFLIKTWNQVRILLSATPEQRARLFLDLAEIKMAETVRLLQAGDPVKKDVNLKRVPELVSNYQEYIQEGSRLLGLVDDPQKRESLFFKKEEQEKQLGLFRDFLEKIGVYVNWNLFRGSAAPARLAWQAVGAKTGSPDGFLFLWEVKKQ